jgi:hypothetical protein
MDFVVKRAEDVAFCTLVFNTDGIVTAATRLVDTNLRDPEKSANRCNAMETIIKNAALLGETLFTKQVNSIPVKVLVLEYYETLDF